MKKKNYNTYSCVIATANSCLRKRPIGLLGTRFSSEINFTTDFGILIALFR